MGVWAERRLVKDLVLLKQARQSLIAIQCIMERMQPLADGRRRHPEHLAEFAQATTGVTLGQVQQERVALVTACPPIQSRPLNLQQLASVRQHLRETVNHALLQ